MTETVSSMKLILNRKSASGSASFSLRIRGGFKPEKVKSELRVKTETSSSSGMVDILSLRLLKRRPDSRPARALSGASVTETEGPSVPESVAFPCSAM